MHGGKSPRGFARSDTKVGRFSKDLPTRLIANYELTRKDPQILEQREEIALIHARILDLIKRVDSGESGHLWRQIRKQYETLVTAIREQNRDTMRVALAALDQLITRGTTDYRAWEEVTHQIDRKQRLIESERKRAVELQQVITMDQMMTFMKVQQHAILKVITDRKLLAQLFDELSVGFRESGFDLPGLSGTVH